MQAFTVDSCIMQVVREAELDLGTFAADKQHVVVDGLAHPATGCGFAPAGVVARVTTRVMHVRL
jgi:hypothetical protein